MIFEVMEELRFVCKLCNKKYPCGKSLGGHMRSHVVANAAESNEKSRLDPDRNTKRFGVGEGSVVVHEADLGTGQSAAYGLRENRRKTWRAVADRREERTCKQCGKAFQSMKALCGHMACHSERERERGGSGWKDDQSWTSENRSVALESCSDSEAEERKVGMRTRLSRTRKCKKVVDESAYLNGSSSVSEIDEQDQEEVALCLMMLSMDNKGGVNSVVESSDNNSIIVETKSSSINTRNVNKESKNNVHSQDERSPQMAKEAEMANSDSAYFLAECTKGEESDVSVDGVHKYGAFNKCKKPGWRQGVSKSLKLIKSFWTQENEYNEDDMASIFAGIESRKRKYGSENPESNKTRRYECFNCKKTFKSYQALGGHRPCHKRTNAFYDSRYESDENSFDDPTEYQTTGKVIVSSSSKKPSTKNPIEKKIKSKNNKGHVCPFCNRIFKNGQALGGHKRSHFIGGHDENINRSTRAKADLLDLNLPAPEVNEE